MMGLISWLKEREREGEGELDIAQHTDRPEIC